MPSYRKLLYMRDPIPGNISPGHPVVLRLRNYAMLPYMLHRQYMGYGLRMSSDRGPTGQDAFEQWVLLILMPCWEVRYADAKC